MNTGGKRRTAEGIFAAKRRGDSPSGVHDSSHRSATSRDASECNNRRVADLLDDLSARAVWYADTMCGEYQAWLPLEDVDVAVEDEPDE